MPKTKASTSAAIAQLSTDTTALQTITDETQHSEPLANWTSQTIDIAQALSNRIRELANIPDLTPSDIGKLAAANKAIFDLGQQLQCVPVPPREPDTLDWYDSESFHREIAELHQ